MKKIKKLINSLPVTGIILFSSCFGDIEDITPKFKSGFETITKQVSRKISSIVKNEVTNIQTFDWVNVLYETTDGSKASDSTDRFVYVFRPNEIR